MLVKAVGSAAAAASRRGVATTAAAAAATAAAGTGHRYVFLGAPGVGKGTFASRVAKALSIPAISTGDIIRAEIKGGTARGAQLQAFTNAGKLVPDSVVNEMVKIRLAEPDAARGYILDGYPRTIEQAQALDAHQVRAVHGLAVVSGSVANAVFAPPRRRSASRWC